MRSVAGDSEACASQWNVLDALQLHITIPRRIREGFIDDGGVVAVR